eukprot:scaffold916_cov516-Prasinococcus_capsulatus_cf.AAC.17
MVMENTTLRYVRKVSGLTPAPPASLRLSGRCPRAGGPCRRWLPRERGRLHVSVSATTMAAASSPSTPGSAASVSRYGRLPQLCAPPLRCADRPDQRCRSRCSTALASASSTIGLAEDIG